MSAARTRCVYEFPNGVPFGDWGTFDRLHHQAASLAHTASKTDGIGGTERLDVEGVFDFLDHARHVAGLAADAVDLAVGTARDHGLSWQQIGDAFGISRQAAQQRFGVAKGVVTEPTEEQWLVDQCICGHHITAHAKGKDACRYHPDECHAYRWDEVGIRRVPAGQVAEEAS